MILLLRVAPSSVASLTQPHGRAVNLHAEQAVRLGTQIFAIVVPDFDNCYRHDRYLSRRINALGVLAKTPMYAYG